jgi:hypothetical protein
MPRLLPALLLGLAACDSGKPDTFKADQPHVSRLFLWDGHTVAEADAFYRIDVDEEKAVRIDLPGFDLISQLAMRGTTPVALGTKGGGRLLKLRVGKLWRDLPLPDGFADVAAPVLLAADDTTILLWNRAGAAWSGDGREWRRLSFPRLREGMPDHLLLRGDQVFLGYDRGEWGGPLLVADLENGTHEVIDSEYPVRQLSVDAKGRVWAVQGLSHVRPGQGILRVLENGAWTVFAHVPALNWPLPPMSFDAMDVDAEGHPWVLGSRVGVARWDGKAWSMATGEWPRHPGSGLRLHNATVALIAMGDRGVALWDGRRMRRVSLHP